jgi:gamma-glutamyltranspeptidase
MSRFTYTPGSPNAPAPGKRMHHNMSPVLALNAGGRPGLAVGMPGGEKIINVTAQVLIGLVQSRPRARQRHPRPAAAHARHRAAERDGGHAARRRRGA